ncbi:MAG: ABC transporter permease [Burkholderiaceae bacterium]
MSAAYAQRAPGDIRWSLFLWPAVAISALLLVLPQAAFIIMSFHGDLGFGQVDDRFTLGNYLRILTDPFYLEAIWLTVYLSAITTVAGLLLGFPTAYALARLGGARASILLSLVVITSLVTIVIKVMGLKILLGSAGLLNGLLIYLGVISNPLQLVNNETGVVIGLIQYTLPILILMLYSGVQTIPANLEEAAAILGASKWSVFRKVIIPLSVPSLVAGALIAFNMSMGAFTSAVLLGGGRVRTLPVLIESKIIQSSEYGLGAALSTTLLLFVFALNVAVGGLVMRGRRRGPRHA